MDGMYNRWSRRRGQRGFVLLLALLFVALFGTVLVSVTTFDNTRTRVAEAEVAGWEMVEIAKAARLYVRDLLVADPNLRTSTTVPTRITITTLKTAGYLPPNFGRPQVGGVDFNALNQAVYVIMANWSPTGLGGAATDDATVPSAFVYFQDGGKSSSGLAINVVENARAQGATITAPLFDGATNISADCRGSKAVAIWDTGCLNTTEFASLVGPLGLPTTFTPSALVMPAWKAVQHDLRAVMRFPQPDNPGYSTMLTDLELGTPTVEGCAATADQVSITTTDASGNPTVTHTGICKVQGDTAGTEQRYNILNVANLEAERVIAEPQVVDHVVEGHTIGTADEEVLNVSGNVLLGNDLKIYNTTPTLPAGVSSRLAIPNGMVAVDRNAYVYSQNTSRIGSARIGTITSKALLSDTLQTTNLQSVGAGDTTGAATMNVTNSAVVSNNTSVIGDADAEWVADTLSAPSATVTASDNTGQVQITHGLDLSGTAVTVNGAVPVSADGYAAITGDIDTASTVTASTTVNMLSANGTITARTTTDYSGTQKMPNMNTADCLEGLSVANGCPNRQYFPPSITP